MQVKIISDVVLVDLNEELVAFEVTEPLDPSGAWLTVVFIVQAICKIFVISDFSQ